MIGSSSHMKAISLTAAVLGVPIAFCCSSPVMAAQLSSTTFDKTTSLSGNANVLFWGKNRDDLLVKRSFLGGNVTFTPSSFDVTTPAYFTEVDAYENTAGGTASIKQWTIPSGDNIVSLGKLRYRNDLLPKDFTSEISAGATISVAVNDPIASLYSKAIYFDFTNRQDGAETITMGYRAGEPKKQQFTNNSPVFFDFLGAKKVGSTASSPLQYSFDVPDNTSVELELFGRVYSTCQRVVGTRSIQRQDYSSAFVPGGAGKYTGLWKAYMVAEFNPNYTLSIPDAAEVCGYDHFNWYQRITSDTQNRNFITDPRDVAFGSNEQHDSYPYYYDETSDFNLYYGEPQFNYAGNFNFRDRPTVAPVGTKPGKVAFQTHLVGVSKNNRCFSESLYQFEWSSSFDKITSFNELYPGKPITYNAGHYNNRPVPYDNFYGEDIVFYSGGCGFVTPQSNAASINQSGTLAETGDDFQAVPESKTTVAILAAGLVFMWKKKRE